MRSLDIHIIILCGLLLAACSSDNETSGKTTIPDGDQPVVFGVAMASDESSTRLVAFGNDISSREGLSAKGGFGVFGCYTGLHKYVDSNVNPDFMYNEHVTSPDNGVTWTYSPIKYWPNGEGVTDKTINTGQNPHYVSFMAYAPYSDNNESTPIGYCIPSFSAQGELSNPWLTYRLIEQENLNEQVDLLYARHTNEHPLLDLKKPAIGDKVLFNFDHALACVGDKVSIFCSTGLQNQTNSRVAGSATNARVEVTGFVIEYTLTSKARLVLWNNGEPNWQTIWSEEPICTRTVTLVDPDDNDDKVVIYANKTDIPASFETTNEWDGYGVFYIPIELSTYIQTAKVSLTYRIGTYNGSNWIYDADNLGTATLTLHDYVAAYQPGKHLYINVTLNQMDIALKAAIAPWSVSEGFPKDVEGIED